MEGGRGECRKNESKERKERAEIVRIEGNREGKYTGREGNVGKKKKGRREREEKGRDPRG